MPESYPNVKTAWLAFPLLIKSKSGLNRKKLQIFLEKKGIQTRTIFTGNILRQPIMKKKFYKKVKNAEMNSNNIMKNGILIGCHHGLVNKDINYITKNLKIPTIGIGSSLYCDGQILVTDDMLGLSGFYPKFVKKYSNLTKIIENAVKKYTRDVKLKKFPSKKYFLNGTERK